MPQSLLTAWLNGSSGSKSSQKGPSHDLLLKIVDSNVANATTPENKPIEDSISFPKDAAPQHHFHPPPNVELRACTKEDITHFKRINSLLLPIPYPESFYRQIIEDPLTNSITLVAVWHDDTHAVGREKGRLIGAIRCRILAPPPTSASAPPPRNEGPMLYLSTLVLLSPYRSYGIAASMLAIMVKRAVTDHQVTSVGAHVWEANDVGLEWYVKRGFKEVRRDPNYYPRLNPATAVVMQMDVGVMDLLNR